MSDSETGWDAVDSNAAIYYERLSANSAAIMVREKCAEWSYDKDAHGYCHDRSPLVVLLKERDALAAQVAAIDEWLSNTRGQLAESDYADYDRIMGRPPTSGATCDGR